MSTITITKRFGGYEDLQFDVDGSGAYTPYYTSSGALYTIHKLNAGHIPITSGIRSKVGNSTNVDAALEWLADNGGGGCVATGVYFEEIGPGPTPTGNKPHAWDADSGSDLGTDYLYYVDGVAPSPQSIEYSVV